MKKDLHNLELRVSLFEKYRELSEKTSPTQKQSLLKQKLELMSYREDFQAKVKLLRNHYGIPENGFETFRDCFDWINTISPQFSSYEKYRSQFHSAFDIGERWFNAVEYYILFNKIDSHSLLPKAVEIEILEDKTTHKPALFLRIWEDTEQRDIIQEWKAIEAFQGIMKSQQTLSSKDFPNKIVKKIKKIDPLPFVENQKNKRNRKSSDKALEKRKQAYLLFLQGKSYVEIGKAIGTNYSNVGIYIDRFRKELLEIKLN